jgi:beta-lactamase regulating signal transducer with metallopeptidase domain
MIPLLLFPVLAAAMVWLAGRRDPARDPRLTTLSLSLLALFPLLLLLPKVAILPAQAVIPTGQSLHFLWINALKLIWISGIIVGLVKLVLGVLGLRSWLKKSMLLKRLEGGIELRQLETIHGPVAAGVFRKVVFVPSEWSEWDEETRATVLSHELAHHHRRDPLVRWIGSLVVALHWFNPLVHWMIRRLALQCEQACDRQVVSNGVESIRYAELLCRFASNRRMPVGALAMAEQSSLELRVRHLMQPKHAKGFITLAVLALITVGGASLLAVAGNKIAPQQAADREEVELRLNADPFPADQP